MSSNSESPRDYKESPRRNVKKNNTNTKKSQKSNGSNGTAAKKKIGLSPWHKAAKNGDLEAVKDLLAKDPNLLNSQDGDNKCTALYHACRRGKIAIVNYLIEKGADVNLGDKTGKNPLHLTAR
jgi:ankyrin repeat protein